jgi:crotonobetainyl-CoA:carnitine CoA-transferase CaiB-like acyl-CoA transferase
VAFGDDAGVAGGLAVAAGGMDAPVFVGDAPADPLSGLTAAARAVQALEWDRGSIIDIALNDVIARAIASQYDPSIDQEVA